MPQLNPAPWFLIFLFTWLFFLTIMPNKVMSHYYNNSPNVKDSPMPESNPWNWPWA
uniref:ATP synthase complex subunit 8 n=1 Tax=Aetobatus flagellum TaxID=420948 RepID=U5TBF0_AETFL|nr:ATP synthase F0 subunit 8 [Aetobatus flagellum]AGY96933.1 ATP synthase F0 subunit 8 [Aetobatus flagellum]